MERIRGLAAGVAALIVALLATTTLSQSARLPDQPAPLTAASDIDRVLEEADHLLKGNKVEEAGVAFGRALEAAQRLALHPQTARALCGIGDVAYQRAQYDEARRSALQCLELSERSADQWGIGRAQLLLSKTAEVVGDFAAARTHAERAIAAFDAAGERGRGPRATATLVLTAVASLDENEKWKLLARAVEDAEATRDADLEADALHAWGDELFTAGHYEDSFEKLTRAAAMYQSMDKPRNLGTVFNSLGRVYRAHGRLDKALEYQVKALDLHKAANSPFELLQSLNAVATVYDRMGDIAKAREYYEHALAIAEKSSSPRIQDFLRANLATNHIKNGQFVRAAEMLEQVLARNLDQYPSLRYQWLADARLRAGQQNEALAAANRAVETCAGDQQSCAYALSTRAAVHRANGNSDAALADIEGALARVEDVRTKLIPADFFKQEFHRVQEEVYSQAIALQVAQHHEHDSLRTAELARSRALIDLLASRDVAFKDRDRQRISALRSGRGIESDRSTSNATGVLTFRGAAREGDAANALRLELESFVTATPATAEDLAAAAARLHSTFVLYWVADDELFIWIVTPKGRITSTRVDVRRARLVELIRATSPSTATPERPAGEARARFVTTRGSAQLALGTDQTRAWRALYDVLIGPIHHALPRAAGSLLTIVPHGPLLNLSFAALRNSAGRYLLEDYTLHYVPAAAVLRYTAAKRQPNARAGDLMLVADPSAPAALALDGPLAPLPGARQEVRAISSLFARDRRTLLEGNGASESRVRATVADKAVVHFATHAIVRDDDPVGSYLALAGGGNGTDSDGVLSAQEIYSLDLNADLVVLSACRSGGGRITGDGIATFARGFIYAGTPSVLVSLWDVADEPTNQLLPTFYRAWLAGASKARSLRQAQLRLLADLRAGRISVTTPVGTIALPEHPVFWAGFVLVGEPE